MADIATIKQKFASTLKKLNEAMADMRAQNESQEMVISELEFKNEALEEENNNARQTLKTLESTKNKLEKENEKRKDTIINLQTRNVDLNEENNQLNERLNKTAQSYQEYKLFEDILFDQFVNADSPDEKLSIILKYMEKVKERRLKFNK